MAQSNTYGRVVCDSDDLPEDEAIFILRASDPFAVKLVDIYRLMHEAVGSSPEVIDKLSNEAEFLEEWQTKNELSFN